MGDDWIRRICEEGVVAIDALKWCQSFEKLGFDCDKLAPNKEGVGRNGREEVGFIGDAKSLGGKGSEIARAFEGEMHGF